MPSYIPENVCINQKDINKNDISIRRNGIGRGLGSQANDNLFMYIIRHTQFYVSSLWIVI
jgi:hypothetical protein